MKILFILLLSGMSLNLWSQTNLLSRGVYKYNHDDKLMSGETVHFSDMELQSVDASNDVLNIYSRSKEQIIIIKKGLLRVSYGGIVDTLGANSIFLLLPGDEGEVQGLSSETEYYQMTYTAKQPNSTYGDEGSTGSMVVDYSNVPFIKHDKGGIRNYFRTSTMMCSYYEMHITSLNAGIKSHEPHTHKASEIVLVIEGETEMEIGQEVFQAQSGDLYFLPSEIPHAIKNIGRKQAMYFAFQWN